MQYSLYIYTSIFKRFTNSYSMLRVYIIIEKMQCLRVY